MPPNVQSSINAIKAVPGWVDSVAQNPTVREYVTNSFSKPKIGTQLKVGAGLATGNAVVKHVNENNRKEIIDLYANKHPQHQPSLQDQAYNPWTDAKSLALGIGAPSIAALLIYNALNRAAQK